MDLIKGFMIENFFTRVQEDIVAIVDRASGKTKPGNVDDENKKVAYAALRIFASLGMGVGILFAVSALPSIIAAPAGALFKMAFGVAIYAFNHDVFVMAQNTTDHLKQNANVAAGSARSVFTYFVDLLKGDKELNADPQRPMTDNTLFRPLWDAAFARLPKKA